MRSLSRRSCWNQTLDAYQRSCRDQTLDASPVRSGCSSRKKNITLRSYYNLCTILLNFVYRLLTHSRDQAQLSNTLTVNQTNNKQYHEPAQTSLQNFIILNYFKKVR